MESIVQRAEKVIICLKKEDKKQKLNMKTNQIRKILSTVNVLKNKVNRYKFEHIGETKLSEELALEVEFLRVNMVYQGGRESSVKNFIEKAGLVEEIKAINKDIDKFESFCKYIEALVAFHKFYGGND